MLGFRAVTTEQEGSLAALLNRADVRHGDTAQVDLVGVGIERKELTGKLHLAFCPASLDKVTVLKSGTPQQHASPIPHCVTLSRRARATLYRRAPRRGFGTLRAVIHSNGTINLRSIEMVKTTEAPEGFQLNRCDSYSNLMASV